MTCIITPVVGDKLWYIADLTDQRDGMKVVYDGQRRKQPMDATVVAVWDDRMVNLVVHDGIGRPFAKKGVRLLQDADTPPRDPSGAYPIGHATWKPSQKAQALRVAANDAAASASVGQVAIAGGIPANGDGPLAA